MCCRSKKILEYWFGPLADENDFPTSDITERWFKADTTTDDTIRCLFGDDCRWALRGDFDHWAERPKDLLALIILLDQFPRNIYRGKGWAFLGDAHAQKLVLAGLERGDDQQLWSAERMFFYMPLMHAESRELQQRCVELFTQLCDTAPKAHRDTLKSSLRYAELHKDVIDRFGRFPHRNLRLARQSSAEELEFLKQPGSSFG